MQDLRHYPSAYAALFDQIEQSPDNKTLRIMMSKLLFEGSHDFDMDYDTFQELMFARYQTY